VLTAIEIKNAKPGRHADRYGLNLMVRPSGSRSWVLRAQKDGKRHDFGIGSAETVSLAQARVLAADLRASLKAGREVSREREKEHHR
jgi:Arm domain-containing DNA-binding protein